jgi:serine/threonine protein kinase
LTQQNWRKLMTETITNPYIYRGPLHDPENFTGRTGNLNEMAAFLRGNQSISIVGPRKIGKTSLLYHLMRRETRARLGLADEYLFTYLDCEVLGESDHDEIYGIFAAEIEATLEFSGLEVDEFVRMAVESPGRIAFERAVRRLNQQKLRLVLILDEFERLSTNPHLNVNFFNALRSAAGRYELAFITASALPLIQLTYSGKSQEILSSPFFNIFALMNLGLFPEAEAMQAIRNPAERAGAPFPEETAALLYKLVGGHPLGIQIAGYHACEHPGDLAEIEQGAARELAPHYQYYWHNLSLPEQHTLLDINDAITRAPSDTTLRGILRDLVQKCLLVTDGDAYRYPSASWEKFVAQQGSSITPISRLRESLVGLNIGPYEIREPLARGGMAEIYKGRHGRLERTVAIKILPTNLASDQDFRSRFEREAQAVASLRHPNIVQVFDFGDVEGLYYMVMEFIAGRSLAETIQQDGAYSLPDALPLIQDLTAALDFAHSRGLIHRDVKPSNILLQAVTSQGMRKRAILTDFGIAKIRGGGSNATKTGILMGTLDYIAPEQIRSSGEVDHRADIYSAGVIVYQMLTGKLPFAGDNPGSVMMSHLQDAPPDPRAACPDLPGYAAAAILRALAKSPDERFAHAGEFGKALANA